MRHWLSCAIFTGLISLRPLLKPVMFLLVPTRKNLPVFLPGKRSVPSSKRSFSPSALGAGITHYTLQAKSCAKGTLSPLDSLPRNRRFLWILPAKKGGRNPPPPVADTGGCSPSEPQSTGRKAACTTMANCGALLWNSPQIRKTECAKLQAHSVFLFLNVTKLRIGSSATFLS